MQSTKTFYPYRSRAWFVFAMAALLLAMFLLVAIGVNIKPAVEPATKPMDGIVIVLALLLGPPMLFLFDIAIGIFRSRVILSDEGLDMTTTRFAIWAIRRVHRAKLKWNEVVGVQLWEQTNPYAPEGIQKDYIVHTSAGRYAIPNILWPQAEEIAHLIAAQIGRPFNDLPENVPRVGANRSRDRIGLSLMHLGGTIAVILGGVMLLASVLALFGGGLDFSAFAKVALASNVAIASGAVMRRWKMQA